MVRWIKVSDAERLKTVFQKLLDTMNRLGVKGSRLSAVGGIPAGSDHFDNGSMNAWLDKVVIEDMEAVAQVKILYATAFVRLKG